MRINIRLCSLLGEAAEQMAQPACRPLYLKLLLTKSDFVFLVSLQFIDIGNVMSAGSGADSEPVTPSATPSKNMVQATPNLVASPTLATAGTKGVTPGQARSITLIGSQPTLKVISASSGPNHSNAATHNANPTKVVYTQGGQTFTTLNNPGGVSGGVQHGNVATPSRVVYTQGQTFTTLGNTSSPVQHHISGVNNANTVTVVAAAPAGVGSSGTPTKTIVVVPVSAAGSGDAQPALKRMKTEN